MASPLDDVSPSRAEGGERDSYRAVGLVTFIAGKDRELVYSEDSDSTRVLPSEEMDLLASCQRFLSLEDHAREFCYAAGFTPDQAPRIREQLDRFAKAGLLVSRRSLLESCRKGGDDAPPPPVAALGVVTRNRVESLQRCLESYIQNAASHGRSPAFVVMDDSQDADTRARNRSMLSALKARHGAAISYAGPEEKGRFVEALVREGLPPDVLRFALSDPEGCGHTTGANRNALLLETLGTMFVSVDDDTVCRMADPPSRSTAGLAFSSEADPMELWFYPDRDTALRSCPFVERDFLAGHQELLGKGPAACIRGAESRGGVDLDPLDARLLRALRSGNGRVRITQSGVIGDSPVGSPNWLSARAGASRERLIRSESDYRASCASREVLCSPRRPTVGNRSLLMTYGTGFDNRGLLPPFMPVFRNQDGLFAITLRHCFEQAWIGYLPWAILHTPPDPRSFSPDEIRVETSQMFMTDVVGSCLGTFAVGTAKPDGRERLRTLGRHLMELGGIPLRDFQAVLRKSEWASTGAWLEGMEADLELLEASAPFWAADVRKSMEDLRQAVTRADYVVPRDVIRARGAAEAPQLSQRLVFRFGELLHAWADIVEAARGLRGRGVGLAQSI